MWLKLAFVKLSQYESANEIKKRAIRISNWWSLYKSKIEEKMERTPLKEWCYTEEDLEWLINRLITHGYDNNISFNNDFFSDYSKFKTIFNNYIDELLDEPLELIDSDISENDIFLTEAEMYKDHLSDWLMKDIDLSAPPFGFPTIEE